MIALKLSLGIFFLRILLSRWQRLLLLTAITLATVFGLALFFFAIFQCGLFSDIEIFMERMIAGTCAKPRVGLAMNYTYAILTTFSDWICGLLPIFILKDSSMPMQTKLVVGFLLALAAM
jgi:hypothetical protein